MNKRLVSLALIAILALACLPAVSSAKAEYTRWVYTENGKSLNVRSEPATGDNIIGSLAYGQAVSVIGALPNGWSTIAWAYGSGSYYLAYVQTRFLVDYEPSGRRPSPNPTAAPTSQTSYEKIVSDMNAEFASAKKVATPYTVTSRPSRASGWVNLRWAPSTEMERIATCPQGKELLVIAELNGWYQVQDPVTGMIGFISRQFVSR